jgi:hypothetical protein
MEKKGSLLVLRDGKYSRATLKAFRIHQESGGAKDFVSEFRGEVFIEVDADGVNLEVFKTMTPQKNEGTPGMAFAAVYSVGLIMLGFAVHHLMLLHWYLH